MREWAIDLIGADWWDRLLAVTAAALIIIVPLSMLFSGLGLWQKLPWSKERDEASASDDTASTAAGGGDSSD